MPNKPKIAKRTCVKSGKPAPSQKREKQVKTNKPGTGKTRAKDVSQLIEHNAMSRGGSALTQLMGDTHASREILLKIVDYFDIKREGDNSGAFQYSFGTANNIFTDIPGSTNPPEGTSINNFVRVLSATFYAMPRFTAAGGVISSDQSGVVVGFAVPAIMPQEIVPGAPEAPTAVSVSQQTTFLEPSSVYRWVRVGQFRQKVFTSTLVQPTFVESFGAMILGTLAALNPDDGQFLDGVGLQCRVDIECTYAIPTVVQFNGAVTPHLTSDVENPWVNRLPLNPEANGVQTGFMEVKGSRDVS